ncbi:expansin EXLX1 family cellulose-binding protein [Plantactinospora sp. GCM10030261]|uniref:expansin EXLX1 family cellulose-binding protein n=1 Tax=Plantactinospora sp. GCM10030261 TaxID=3273420 RepID=UPI00361B74B9
MTDEPQTASQQPARGTRRAPHRWSRRWLVGGGTAVLAAVVGVAVAVQAGGAPACAAALSAPPTGGTAHQGKATFYDSNGGGGNCSLPAAPANRMYVALGPGEYVGGAACGGYLDVSGPKGKVRVLIMDQCPECPTGHIDLSKEAFARIADPVRGIVPVTYRGVVDPTSVGPLTFRMKDGASRYWFAVQVGNHGNPLRSVEVQPAGGGAFRSAVRHDFNYWIVDAGMGPGPYAIRVTDVYGHRATATGVKMLPEQVQLTGTYLYGSGAGRGAARPTASPTRRPSPSPSVTVPASSPTAPAPSTTAGLLTGIGPATPTGASACG